MWTPLQASARGRCSYTDSVGSDAVAPCARGDPDLNSDPSCLQAGRPCPSQGQA